MSARTRLIALARRAGGVVRATGDSRERPTGGSPVPDMGSVRELSLLLSDSTALAAERLATIGLELSVARAARAGRAAPGTPKSR